MTVPIEVLTRPEAAAYLRISVRKLDQLRDAGDIAETRIGGVLRFRLSVLNRYLDRKTRKAS